MDSRESATVKPGYTTQLPGLITQTDWVLDDLSVDSSRIAVCGNNYTDTTAIELFALNYSDSSSLIQSPVYSREFPESTSGLARYVAFTDDLSLIVTVYGTQIELYNVTKNETLSHHTMADDEEAQCITVKGRQLFVGLYESNQVIVFDINFTLKKIRNISLMGIDDEDYPECITVENKNIFITTMEGRALKYDIDGKMLHEYPKLDKFAPAHGLTASSNLDLVFIAWGSDKNITVYSLSESLPLFSFVASGTYIIRINSANRLFKASKKGELDVYSTTTIFTYEHLKIELTAKLTKDECEQLGYHFSLPPDQVKSIISTESHSDMLFLALEERGYVHTSDVNSLTDALIKLGIRRDHLLTETYMKLRGQETDYGRFIASLSTHLILWIPEKLCDYFKFTDEQMTAALSSQNPGLSVLLMLEEMGVINPFDVSQLETFLQEYQLVQAVAKIQDYLSSMEAQRTTDLSDEGKESIFIKCLQRKMKSWFETMTPVPWKKSCQWKTDDLFIASGLVLTKSGSKTFSKDVDPKSKLYYRDIFNHERLKGEKRVILEGEPGSGKTMLSSQLAYDWSCGELKNIPIVIFLPLKVVGDMTLIQAIQMFYIRKDIPISQDDIEAILNSDEDKIYLILDGLEEYNGKVQEGETSEIMKVMMKEKLANCTVLITARSDFAKELPPYPMLRIGGFGEEERNAYINRLHSEDIERCEKVKEVIDSIPLLLDICSVPLLFVLTVHNIDSLGQIEDDQLRVTPFVKAIVGILCPAKKSYYDHDYMPSQQHELDTMAGDTASGYTPVRSPLGDDQYDVHQHNVPHLMESYENEPTQQAVTDVDSSDSQAANIPLEELAFNGLCRGNQQLVWQKDFVDKYLINSKEWIDAGILLVEEGTPANIHGGRRRRDSISELVHTETTGKPLGVESDRREYQMIGDDAAVKEVEGGLPADVLHSKEESESKQESKQESKSQTSPSLAEGSSAKYVSLHIKFLHKLIQEWFAAKFLALLFWGCKTTDEHTKSELFVKHLAYIDPADLHYVLRFTCHICPPSFPIITSFLMQKFRKENSWMPEFITNCICHCFSEFDGYRGHKVRDIVAEICGNEIITITSEDSRLLMQSKISFLSFASNKKIPIKYLRLTDIVEGATDKSLVMQFGVSLGRLDTLEALEVNRWDQKLKDEDYEDIIAYIANSTNIKEASLLFPSPPRFVKDYKILEKLRTRNSSVKWTIGAKLVHTLDNTSGEWTMEFRRQGAASGISEVTAKEGYQDVKASRLGSLEGAEDIERKRQISSTSDKDDTEQQVGAKDDFILHLAEVEAKVDEEGGVVKIPGTNVELDIPRGALEEELSIQMRIIPPHLQHDSERSFSSFSSVVVELLPDDTKLLLPAKLILPHCLILNENSELAVTIYDSHHAKGSKPVWKVQSETRYELRENDCLVWLKSFCWKKYKVADKLVKGKKITVYAAMDQSSTKDLLLLEVGYYLDLPCEKEIIEKNKLAVLKEKPFIFLKKGEMPLTVSFEKNVPVTWHFVTPKENPKVIPFQDVALYEEYTCSFYFTRVKDKDCLCSFSASQGQGNVDLSFVLSMGAVQSPAATAVSPTQDVQAFSFGSSATGYIRAHESVVTHKSLQKLSSKITAEWREIGRKLKVTEGELSHLREDYPHNQKEVIYQMLITWKNKRGTAATCRTLRKALKKCKRADLLKYVK